MLSLEKLTPHASDRAKSWYRHTTVLIGLLTLLALTACADQASDAMVQERDKALEEGAVHVPAFDLPPSEFLSAESLAALELFQRQQRDYAAALAEQCPRESSKGSVDYRQCLAKKWYQTGQYKALRRDYPVDVTLETIAGVPVEIFAPESGIAAKNQKRVLINLHGGAFIGGSRTASQKESIPIAALGRIKVVSVDYRMAPEYQFPAATEDVVAVFKELLKDYKPENIGIYGCSAGGRLTGQVVATLIHEKIPKPGAIAILCSPPMKLGGDSNHIVWAMKGRAPMSIYDFAYFEGVAPDNALAFPGESPAMLAHFPPSLLLTSTRDYSLSPMVEMHSEMIKQSVDAELHIWDGLDHAFLYNAALPESREAYDVIVGFFEQHLGTSHEKRK